MIESLPQAEVALESTWRIIASRYPRIPIFERIASPDRFEMLLEIESMTNPRIRLEMGAIEAVPKEDWVTGPGADFIMSAFTKFSPDRPSRFSDGSYGVYYCARERETAVEETVYHRERFMRFTNEEPELMTMRVLTAGLNAQLYDIRLMRADMPYLYALGDYHRSQALGQELKSAQAWGITYASVRHEGGECFGVFRPKALNQCQENGHLGYFWDGDRIHVSEMLPLAPDAWLNDI